MCRTIHHRVDKAIASSNCFEVPLTRVGINLPQRSAINSQANGYEHRINVSVVRWYNGGTLRTERQ